MKTDLMDNLSQVRDEAQSMLKTLSAVKGDSYARHVQILLLLRQSANIAGILCEEAAKVDPERASACAQAMTTAFQGIAGCLPLASGISKDDWKASLDEANRFADNVDGLIASAIESFKNGSGFGGAND